MLRFPNSSRDPPPSFTPVGSARPGWRCAPGVRPSGVVVFGISRLSAGDEVVAVLEARASAAADDVVDQVRRRVRETAGLELDRVVIAPLGTIPRTTSGKVRRAETRDRLEAGTLTAHKS